MHAIEIQQLTKKYASFTALNDVSLSIKEGEFFALLGPNGAGKTTLISIIAGLARATSGSVKVHGFDVIKDFRQARQHLGVVPQELVFDPFFTVRETLRLQSGYFGLRNNDAWIDEILHHLALTEKANSNMRSLSGGMKRRVLIAQALVHKPPVIILDEPTAGVDVELRQILWRFITSLHQQGHTIILTTHYLEEAQSLCQRVAMLKAGRIIALDTTDALLNTMQSTSRELRVQLKEKLLTHADWSQYLDADDQEGKRLIIPIREYTEVETILKNLREAQLQIDKLELIQPDLEDVFLHVMSQYE